VKEKDRRLRLKPSETARGSGKAFGDVVDLSVQMISAWQAQAASITLRWDPDD